MFLKIVQIGQPQILHSQIFLDTRIYCHPIDNEFTKTNSSFYLFLFFFASGSWLRLRPGIVAQQRLCRACRSALEGHNRVLTFGAGTARDQTQAAAGHHYASPGGNASNCTIPNLHNGRLATLQFMTFPVGVGVPK